MLVLDGLMDWYNTDILNVFAQYEREYDTLSLINQYLSEMRKRKKNYLKPWHHHKIPNEEKKSKNTVTP